MLEQGNESKVQYLYNLLGSGQSVNAHLAFDVSVLVIGLTSGQCHEHGEHLCQLLTGHCKLTSSAGSMLDASCRY